MNNQENALKELKDFLVENQTDFSKPVADEFDGDDQFPFPCKENNFTTSKPYTCDKCQGKGKVAKTYANGMTYVNKCKSCNGEGGFMSSPEAREKSRLARVKAKEVHRMKMGASLKKQLGEDAFAHLIVADSDFMKSLWEQGIKRGELSEKQVACIEKDMIRKADYEHKKFQNTLSKAKINLSEINKHLNTATENKLKKPFIKCIGDTDKVFTFKNAPMHGKNAGYVYVTYEGEYLGKINQEGDFFGWETPEDVVKQLKIVAESASDATLRYGRKFGKCGVCSRQLTKERSILAGIGPVCADKYGIEY